MTEFKKMIDFKNPLDIEFMAAYAKEKRRAAPNNPKRLYLELRKEEYKEDNILQIAEKLNLSLMCVRESDEW